MTELFLTTTCKVDDPQSEDTLYRCAISAIQAQSYDTSASNTFVHDIIEEFKTNAQLNLKYLRIHVEFDNTNNQIKITTEITEHVQEIPDYEKNLMQLLLEQGTCSNQISQLPSAQQERLAELFSTYISPQSIKTASRNNVLLVNFPIDSDLDSLECFFQDMDSLKDEMNIIIGELEQQTTNTEATNGKPLFAQSKFYLKIHNNKPSNPVFAPSESPAINMFAITDEAVDDFGNLTALASSELSSILENICYETALVFRVANTITLAERAHVLSKLAQTLNNTVRKKEALKKKLEDLSRRANILHHQNSSNADLCERYAQIKKVLEYMNGSAFQRQLDGYRACAKEFHQDSLQHVGSAAIAGVTASAMLTHLVITFVNFAIVAAPAVTTLSTVCGVIGAIGGAPFAAVSLFFNSKDIHSIRNIQKNIDEYTVSVQNSQNDITPHQQKLISVGKAIKHSQQINEKYAKATMQVIMISSCLISFGLSFVSAVIWPIAIIVAIAALAAFIMITILVILHIREKRREKLSREYHEIIEYEANASTDSTDTVNNYQMSPQASDIRRKLFTQETTKAHNLILVDAIEYNMNHWNTLSSEEQTQTINCMFNHFKLQVDSNTQFTAQTISDFKHKMTMKVMENLDNWDLMPTDILQQGISNNESEDLMKIFLRSEEYKKSLKRILGHQEISITETPSVQYIIDYINTNIRECIGEEASRRLLEISPKFAFHYLIETLKAGTDTQETDKFLSKLNVDHEIIEQARVAFSKNQRDLANKQFGDFLHV